MSEQPTDELISVFTMNHDPRLRRLFKNVGQALGEAYSTENFVDDRTLDALYDDLLTLAPEYLPEDEHSA